MLGKGIEHYDGVTQKNYVHATATPQKIDVLQSPIAFSPAIIPKKAARLNKTLDKDAF